MTINYKNLAIGLVFIIATNALTAYIVYTVSTKANMQTIEAYTPTIEKAIAKQTTAITNSIEIKDNKFKKNDSLHIFVDQKPTNSQENLFISGDTIKNETKKSWIGRLFSKK